MGNNQKMIHKIVFLDAETVGEVPQLADLNQFGSVTSYPFTAPEQTLERVKDCHIIITNKVVIDQKVMAAAANLQLICVAATGINNIDLAYAQQKGILVKNVAGYSTNSVTQHTFSLLFYLLERLNYYDQYVKTGQYAKSPIFTHVGKPFWELAGKRFGIIGLGAIGQQVAQVAKAFGAEVVYYSTSGKNNNNTYQRLDLPELLQTSDVVSIHSPLNDQTRNLLNYTTIKWMKPTAILLNTGRGGIIQEADLAKVLDEELIFGAGLDVLVKEPILEDNPLLSIKQKDRLLITPHIAWTSIEARAALVAGVCTNIREFLASNS